MDASTSTSETCQVTYLNPPQTHTGYARRPYQFRQPYIAFIDIPYAKAPEGLERCQPPKSFPSDETAGPSTTTHSIDLTPKICLQPDDSSSSEYKGTLDCLYLNVYLPRKPDEIKELLPVLVYIHGGGFTYGSKSEAITSPDRIVQHDLVFVTLNYRLGAVGYMNLGTDDVPGNAGLKDQVKALEWIRDNIICFKGDPKNVTISGQSAGGSNVNFHLISEQSKDLFHKAIVQSGGVYCPWGYRGHQRERKQMLLRDKKFNELLVDPNKSEELQKHTTTLVRQDSRKRHPEAMSPLFGPTVEKKKAEAFIPDSLEKMMKNVIDFDKPVMAGIAKEEGISHFRSNDAKTMYNDLMHHDEIFCSFLMDNLRWSKQDAKKCLGVVKNKYFPEHLQTSEAGRLHCLQNLVRDFSFFRFYDNFKFGPKKTLPEKLYVYRFDHVSEISAVKRDFKVELFNDATHCDELNYLYGSQEFKREWSDFIYEGPKQNPEIRQVMDHMCSLWANFCKDGVPKSDCGSDNDEWRCHKEDDPCFLSISKNLRLIKEPLFKEEWCWLNALVSSQSTLDSPDTPE